MSKFKMSLKGRKSPHFYEKEPRYDVLLNGEKVDELYYNMNGYRGALMDVRGRRVDIGERGITAWKKEVSYLNREAREILSGIATDRHRLAAWDRTSDGDVMKLTFAAVDASRDGVVMHVDRNVFIAGMQLLGTAGLGPAYFEAKNPVEDFVTGETVKPLEMWDQTKFVMGIMETSDPEWLAVATGSVPPITGKIIADPDLGSLPDGWDIGDLADRLPGDWSDGVDHVVFVRESTMAGLVEANGRAFMRADLLPGKGIFSERGDIFSTPITSTGQRPQIVLSERDDRLFGEAIRRIGLRVEKRELDDTLTP